jgi:molybdenum cofactor sulfurtransferase
VLGIRESCLQRGGDFCALREEEVEGRSCAACARKLEEAAAAADGRITPLHHQQQPDQHQQQQQAMHLLSFPAQDNFSGVKYSLSWIEQIQNLGDVCGKKGDWRVLVDAAAFVPSNRLDLGTFHPDFVSISFYKLFGLPTGLGALLVHKRSIDILQKHYWGGGSVVVASPTHPIQIFKMDPCERLEDGTLNFLSIAALLPGFRSLEELKMERIQKHVWALTRFAYEQLVGLRHSNGAPVVLLYGKHDRGDKHLQGSHCSWGCVLVLVPVVVSAALPDGWIDGRTHGLADFPTDSPIDRPTIHSVLHSLHARTHTHKHPTGGILSFNLLRPDGTFVGYHFVQKQAMARGFHIRSGCSCNPGACFGYLGIRAEEISTFFLNKESCGDSLDVVNGGRLPLGAVRVSVGSLTTFEEIQAFVVWVQDFFVDTGSMAALGLHRAPRGPSSGPEDEGGLVDAAPAYPLFDEHQGHAAVA